MTVKTETTFYKNLKKYLEDGDDKFIVIRIESYATPGFPDCIIYHNDLGFFTLELGELGIFNFPISCSKPAMPN